VLPSTLFTNTEEKRTKTLENIAYKSIKLEGLKDFEVHKDFSLVVLSAKRTSLKKTNYMLRKTKHGLKNNMKTNNYLTKKD